MLIRRKISKEQTVREGRQGSVKYFITKQEVRLDPWENDDCAEVIGREFSVTPIGLEGWSLVSCTQLIGVAREKQFVQILEDPETGYIYFRRTVDIQRQLIWNENHSFRVSAEDW